MRTMTLLLLTALFLPACGSGDSLEKQCESAMTSLCDRACECDTSLACALTAGQGSLITFKDRNECLGWYVGLACPQADQAPAGFFTACETALASAQCQTEPDEALMMPDDCIIEE